MHHGISIVQAAIVLVRVTVAYYLDAERWTDVSFLP